MEKPLKEIVNQIVKTADPDKIILFGSRSSGKTHQFSDYDLCVLKSGVKQRRKLTQKIYRSLFGTGIPVDIIVQTPKKFDQLKDKWFLIYHDIAKYGKAIYEK